MSSTSKRAGAKSSPAIGTIHATRKPVGPRRTRHPEAVIIVRRGERKVEMLGVDDHLQPVAIVYEPKNGIHEFVRMVSSATPLELVEAERGGVKGRLVKDLAVEMDIPVGRFYDILGVPKATIEDKAAKGKLIAGAGGQRALAMVRLLGMAQEIVERSTSAEARGFDAARWLGNWIERPQPALHGRRPADFLDTPTGFEIVAKTLGALESGSYL